MARGFALAAFLTVLAAALSAGALASPARTAAAPFPVTVTVTNGKVTVPKRPARIVSLSPTATETLFAIGAGAQVVAVDDQSDYPKNAPRTTLSGFTPNVESIAGYRPDLVVISFDPKGLSRRSASSGSRLSTRTRRRRSRARTSRSGSSGTLTGHAPQADGLVDAHEAADRLDRGEDADEDDRQHRVPRARSDALSASRPTRSSAGSTRCSACATSPTRRRAGTDYPQLSAEYVVSANPDLIVLADTVCCGAERAHRRLTSRVVRGSPRCARGSVVRLDDSIASRWGPRLVNFVRAIGTALDRLGRQ